MLKDIEDELGFDISLSERETLNQAKKSFLEGLDKELIEELGKIWMK